MHTQTHTYTVQKSKDPAAEAAKKKAELEKRLEVCVIHVDSELASPFAFRLTWSQSLNLMSFYPQQDVSGKLSGKVKQKSKSKGGSCCAFASTSLGQ